MKIWLDTTNVDLVKKANALGILYGVTTNPSLIAQSNRPMKIVLQELLDHQDGPVTAQVIAADVAGMIDQAKQLYDFSDRIIVKIPVTQEGYEAIHHIAKQEIPVMATVVLEPHQAMVAAIAGAAYIAPYVGQIEKSGKNPWEALAMMLKMYQHGQMKTEILAASISTVDQISRCAEMGIPHITLKDGVFLNLIGTNSVTLERVRQFKQNWEQAQKRFL